MPTLEAIHDYYVDLTDRYTAYEDSVQGWHLGFWEPGTSVRRSKTARGTCTRSSNWPCGSPMSTQRNRTGGRPVYYQTAVSETISTRRAHGSPSRPDPAGAGVLTHRGPPDLGDRYRLCPQMRVYDTISELIAPHLTYVQQPDFQSEMVNTDQWATCGPERLPVSISRPAGSQSRRWGGGE